MICACLFSAAFDIIQHSDVIQDLQSSHQILLVSPQIEVFDGSGNIRSDGKAYVHNIRAFDCVGECCHASDELGGEMDTTAGYRRRRCIGRCLNFLLERLRRHVDVQGAQNSQCKDKADVMNLPSHLARKM